MELIFAATQEKLIDAIVSLEQDPVKKLFIFPYTKQGHAKAIKANHEFQYSAKGNNNMLVDFIILAKASQEHDLLEFRKIVILY